MSAVIELESVSKTYAGTAPVTALREVSVTVGAGEGVAVLGPSGSGKSTLLHVMGALEMPSVGVVRIAGRDITTLPDPALSAVRAHRIGFVFQQFFLLDHLDAVGNVALGLLYRGRPEHERRAAAVATLQRVGLGPRLSHRPTQLSGGERQRVAIAHALVGRPAVILADEPTGNLDSESGAAVLALLAELDTTVVVVTHDPHVAAAMDRLIEVHDGRIVTDRVKRPVP